MRVLSVLIVLLSYPVWAGNVLFIDLNDSKEEVRACARGVRDASPLDANGNREDSLFVINKSSMSQLAHHQFNPNGSIGAADIDAYVREMEDHGQKIDSIVISGHDGNGQYFGSQGTVTAEQMKWVLDRNRHTLTHDNVQMMMQWGCYTGNANACENVWGKNISENINTTIGFTVQSPDNTRPGNFTLLEDVCKKRKEITAATTEQQYDELFRNLAGVGNWNVGLCKPEGVCSPDYARKDAQGRVIPGQNCYHSYDELQRRCAEFDPDHKMEETYRHYLNADPGYENPPRDDASFVYANGSTGRNPIRNYYGELHLWRHCAKTDANPQGFEMESPSRAIRLTRFDDVKFNFSKMHKAEIDQFNSRLRTLGLDQYVLENFSGMNRAQIIQKTMGAVSALETMAKQNRSVSGVNTSAMYQMAVQFDRTLRVLQPRCIPFSWVHSDMGENKSPCIAPYGQAPAWPPPQ